MTTDREFSVTTSDGFTVRGLERAIPAPRAAVVLCHGIGSTRSHFGLFDQFADAAARNRVSAIRFDFRAHGASDGDHRDLTLSGAAADLAAVIEQRVDRDVPLFLVGLSFGCGPATRFCTSEIDRDVQGLVLWNPVIRYAATFLQPNNEWSAAIVASRDAGRLQGMVATLPDSGLTMTERLMQEFVEDDTEARLRAALVPVVLFHATQDQKVPFVFSADVASVCPMVELMPVTRADHSFSEERSNVVSKSLTWITAHISK